MPAQVGQQRDALPAVQAPGLGLEHTRRTDGVPREGPAKVPREATHIDGAMHGEDGPGRTDPTEH